MRCQIQILQTLFFLFLLNISIMMSWKSIFSLKSMAFRAFFQNFKVALTAPFFLVTHLTNYQLTVILSIDSERALEVIIIFLSTQSKKSEVIAFLNELKSILENEDFDIDKHLTLINKNKQGEDQKYSTPYTLLDLDYDTEDVVERLKELTIAEYAETKIDKDDLNPPLLFVFGKDINSKLVYVKLKIKGDEQRHVLCVSFHYAKEKMTFPYI